MNGEGSHPSNTGENKVDQHLTMFFNFQGKHGLQFIFSGGPRFSVHLHTVADSSLRAIAECLQQRLGVRYKNSQAEKDFYRNRYISHSASKDGIEQYRMRWIPPALHMLQRTGGSKHPPLGQRVFKIVIRVTDQFLILAYHVLFLWNLLMESTCL